MDLPTQLGQLKTGQEGKGLLQKHLWCPNDLARLWDHSYMYKNLLCIQALVPKF